MRIALVSALALPHFVGGATVQVHRVAVALRRLGVEVHIFSGARRPESRDMALRREIFEGFPVTSINTEAFLAFDDPRNYDNPGADEAVLNWLAEVDPDAVHAHSLQGLGAGWMDRASQRWPLVVTMHDWWWVCARQFLVTTELEADGPLVDGAACECAGGVEFNRRRRAWLANRLVHAEQVLVPSAALRDSLVANGYTGERITVDPNGVALPRSAEPEDGVSADRVPMLGFVGGWHEFKGLPILLAARRRLPDEPLPLRINCWGAGKSPASRELPPGVTVMPPYPPEGTAAVMAGLDALAVPSLMRESFSLVTAEALAAGVPVICSDNGGAELLVSHGLNGLVVETGNVGAWSAALSRWAGDRGLRSRLRQGAAAPPGLVTVDEQAANVLEVYRTLTVRAAGARAAGAPVTRGPRPAEPGLLPAAGARPRGIQPDAGRDREDVPALLVVSGIEGAPLRYRGHQLVQAHRALGGAAHCMHYRDPRVLDSIPPGGLVVFYRVPWSSWVRRCLEATRAAGAVPVFSVDDLVFDPSLRESIPALRALPAGEAELWMEGVERYRRTADACGLFIGSTPMLVAAARRQGWSAHLWDNHLGAETALLSQVALRESREARASREASGTCRIAYFSGTTSHDDDWAVAEAAIIAVLERRPNVELWLAGHLEAGRALPPDHPRVRRLEFRPFQEIPRLQAEADIVVAPLEAGIEFSEAKSAIKWMEAAALCLPVVASPTAPFRAVIEDGVTGILAAAEGWEEAIDRLAGDVDLRRRIGLAARRAVYRDHGPWSGAGDWALLWPQLRRDERLVPAGVPSEEPTPWALEPEAPTGYLEQTATEGDSLSAPLGGEATVSFELENRYSRLWRIDVRATGQRPGGTALCFELRGPAGRLASGEVPADEISDGGWTAWEPGRVAAAPGAQLTVVVTQPGAPPGRGVRLWQDDAGACNRAWAAADRAEISVAATGQPPAPRPRRARGTGRHRLQMLWFKGRASLESAGLRPTAFRMLRVAQRELRGALRRLQARSRNRR